MSKIALSGSAAGSGTFTLAAPNSDSSYTLNLPQVSGGTLVSTTSSGTVGLGTSSPSAELHVNKDTGSEVAIKITSADTAGYTQTLYFGAPSFNRAAIKSLNANTYDGNLLFFTGNSSNFQERMRIDASGNVVIGTSSPNANSKLTLADGTAAAQYFNSTGSGGDTAYIALQKSADGLTFGCENRGFVWKTGSATVLGGTERMRIDSSGNLLVGTTSTLGDGKVHFKATSASAVMRAQVYADGWYVLGCMNAAGSTVGGVVANASTTTYATTSDYRLKENIQPMQNALAVVQQLNPVTYTWKSDGSDGQGFIAHELQAVVPDCVTGEKDAVDADGNPVYQGIDTSFLVATLTKAIQEQQEQINQLKAEVAALKSA